MRRGREQVTPLSHNAMICTLTWAPILVGVKLAWGFTHPLLHTIEGAEFRRLTDELVESLSVLPALPTCLAAWRPVRPDERRAHCLTLQG